MDSSESSGENLVHRLLQCRIYGLCRHQLWMCGQNIAENMQRGYLKRVMAFGEAV